MLRNVLVEKSVRPKVPFDERVDLSYSADVNGMDGGERVHSHSFIHQAPNPGYRLRPCGFLPYECVVLLFIGGDQVDDSDVQPSLMKLTCARGAGVACVCVDHHLWNSCLVLGVVDDLRQIVPYERLAPEDLHARSCARDIVKQSHNVSHGQEIISLLRIAHSARQVTGVVDLDLHRPQDRSNEASQTPKENAGTRRSDWKTIDHAEDYSLLAQPYPRLQSRESIKQHQARQHLAMNLFLDVHHNFLIATLHDLTSIYSSSYDENTMRFLRNVLCLILAALMPALPVIGEDLQPSKADAVRTWMTIGSSLISVGVAGSAAFFISPEGTPLANLLLVAIPVSGVAAAAGAMAGRWVADTTLSMKPSGLVSPLVGAGLGLIAGAFIGGISFALTAAIAIPVVEAEPGYWGSFTYLQAVGMGLLAGAFWGGLSGIPAGAVAVPIISIYMSF